MKNEALNFEPNAHTTCPKPHEPLKYRSVKFHVSLRTNLPLLLTLRSFTVWQIILAAGWPIWPLIIASVVALAIIGER